MNYTENYQLNQWDAGDRVLREDFNADNEKIDVALEKLNTEKCEILFGTYTGNGNSSRTVSLSFTPKAVYVCNAFGYVYRDGCHYGGLALEGYPAKATSSATGNVDLITIKENGFQVENNSVQSGGGGYISANLSGTVYHYIAFR